MDMKAAWVNWDVVECDAFGRLVGLAARVGLPEDGAAAVRRLLVPVDGSPASLEAVQLAARLADGVAGTELHVLNAQSIIGPADGDDVLMQQGMIETQAARGLLDAMQVPYLLRLAAGNPAEAILAHVHERRISEIVMGADGAGGLASALLGSVAMDVVAGADVPVTLVKSGCGLNRMPAEWVDWLVACDGSKSSLRALRHVLSLLGKQEDEAGDGASGERARIHLLNVCVPDGRVPSFAASADGNADRSTFARCCERAREECREALYLVEAAGVDHEFHVALGDPVAEILKLAEDAGCGHIVMGSRGLGWLGGVVLGSVSRGVLFRTPMPVTLVK